MTVTIKGLTTGYDDGMPLTDAIPLNDIPHRGETSIRVLVFNIFLSPGASCPMFLLMLLI